MKRGDYVIFVRDGQEYSGKLLVKTPLALHVEGLADGHTYLCHTQQVRAETPKEATLRETGGYYREEWRGK